MKDKDTADILLNHFSPDELQKTLGVNVDTSILPQEQEAMEAADPLVPSMENDEDFINERGEFTGKLKLYDDDEGTAALAYHGLAGEIVRAIDPHTEGDPIATLITFLTAYGNIIGDKAHFTAGARQHPARLFSVIVGATGKGRKGTSLSPVRLLFKAVNSDWEKDHILSGMSSGEGLIHAVRDEVTKKVPITKGEGKDKKVTGYETEVIDEGVDDKRMFVIEEEFGKTLRAAKREGNTLSAIIRELWDTGSPRTLTKSPVKATAAHISILGQITQDELKKEISDVDLVNGLANRFLWLMVERSKLLPSGGFFHKVDVSGLVEKIRAAVEFGSVTGEITRDLKAEALWHRIYEPLSTGVGGLIGAVTSRAEAQTMRLACIYALLDQSDKITVIHLKAALDLWGYCFRSARFIFGSGAILEQPNAIKLLDELKRREGSGEGGMTRNEVREFFNRNLSKAELDIVINDLISNGFIKVEKERKPGSKKPIQKITLLE
ncbi:DUF3987 domain-containing protein [Domibacillus mangrovi]|uniref:DUF3987 domain-containing protein n=1 Tax=Domibacillus mangrovi TaxID=1714354 RepID=A0A1Q5P207_9BACI|nr:DUF3987 domain-containing protein [Domibacillus mangrovi]OKL36228.1 hypothetical protein BLL40_11500 [Domibacillus mangrovi]